MSAGMHEFQSSFVKALLGASEPTAAMVTPARASTSTATPSCAARSTPSRRTFRACADCSAPTPSTPPPARSCAPGLPRDGRLVRYGAVCPTSSPPSRSWPTSTTCPASPRSISPGSTRIWPPTLPVLGSRRCLRADRRSSFSAAASSRTRRRAGSRSRCLRSRSGATSARTDASRRRFRWRGESALLTRPERRGRLARNRRRRGAIPRCLCERPLVRRRARERPRGRLRLRSRRLAAPTSSRRRLHADRRRRVVTSAWRERWNRIADRLERWIRLDAVLLVSRVAIAAVFFLSGAPRSAASSTSPTRR